MQSKTRPIYVGSAFSTFFICSNCGPKRSNILWSPLSDPLHLDVQTDAAVNNPDPGDSEENWRTAGAGIPGRAILEQSWIGCFWRGEYPTKRSHKYLSKSET